MSAPATVHLSVNLLGLSTGIGVVVCVALWALVVMISDDRPRRWEWCGVFAYGVFIGALAFSASYVVLMGLAAVFT